MTSPSFKYETYKTSQINRNIRYKFKKLNQLRTEPLKFWTFAYKHLLRNRSYQIINLNHVYPGWYNKSYGKILKVLKELCHLDLKNYKSSYFTVPKSNGGTR